MIERIEICKVATYGAVPEALSDLKEINFVYGSNGTGKTTISRVIADCSSHEHCSLVWRSGSPMELLVYNRDFVERNFNQPDELKGIFSLGEKDKNTLDKIDAAKTELDEIKKQIVQLKGVLQGDGGNGGKRAELADLETEFEGKCWDLKLRHDAKLQGAFVRVRGKKSAFKARLLEESVSNSSAATSLTDLENKASTVFGEAPQATLTLAVPNGANLIAHETNEILKKKVIGKTDVDIAALIQKLGNSDWVKQGRDYYDTNKRVCPFCQQDTPLSLEKSLNEYFDETFTADTASIEELYTDYKTDSERIQRSVQALLDNPSKFLDADKLQSESELLASKIRINIQRIEDKRRESSKSVELDSLKNVLDAINKLVEDANVAILKHNIMVSNLEAERTQLTGQVWRYLLDHEIKADLAAYIAKKKGIKKAIESLETKIVEGTEDQRTKNQEIKALEKNTTSIQPTIDGINALLHSFGFTGFALAKSEREPFYKIQRLDGSDAKETLSEGEKSFITFLYFYHLLKGSESETGMTSDRVVVFDDPVSSLDSDILFIVSNLIKGVFDEVRAGSGTIKQVFVLTHNVYFHKEVSFHPNRCADGRLKDETFWTVRKSNQESRFRHHETNPIKTSYELLWIEVRNPDRDNLAIQNTMRRILENYFKILGNVNPDDICAHFEGKEKLICRSLFSWVNDGSHFAHDSLYVSIDDSMVDSYLRVFKRIFDETGHIAHYNMMMGVTVTPEMVETGVSDTTSLNQCPTPPNTKPSSTESSPTPRPSDGHSYTARKPNGGVDSTPTCRLPIAPRTVRFSSTTCSTPKLGKP
ncbi:AAA family ATPase [Desulfonatronum thiodismutans]|uniref:AAA family ATPase n=1 Tax=Desulfonatronum thiodismutans TaxID=159290 RepID=UPI000A034C8F|nr:AAA family ATPase [Desulfonatronum thiodismutans]